MKKIILHLLLVISIAFSPVGQSFAMQMDNMDKLITCCMSCDHTQDNSQASCFDASCISYACHCSTTTSGMLFADTFSSLHLNELSTMIFDQDQSPYFSQITLPLYRPPIA